MHNQGSKVWCVCVGGRTEEEARAEEAGPPTSNHLKNASSSFRKFGSFEPSAPCAGNPWPSLSISSEKLSGLRQCTREWRQGDPPCSTGGNTGGAARARAGVGCAVRHTAQARPKQRFLGLSKQRRLEHAVAGQIEGITVPLHNVPQLRFAEGAAVVFVYVLEQCQRLRADLRHDALVPFLFPRRN